jgi:hypothetical protein
MLEAVGMRSLPLGGVVLLMRCMGTETARRYGGLRNNDPRVTERTLSVRANANRARFSFRRKCSLSLSLLVKSENK